MWKAQELWQEKTRLRPHVQTDLGVFLDAHARCSATSSGEGGGGGGHRPPPCHERPQEHDEMGVVHRAVYKQRPDDAGEMFDVAGASPLPRRDLE
jgi:hypothetical protein